MIGRVVTLVRDTLSWPVLHKCEVSWLYSKRFSSYGANTKLYLKPSRGNSESMKVRVVILVRDTSSWSVLHSCEVTWLYSKEYLSYRADTKLHLKWSRGNNSESMTGRVATLICDTLSWPALHSYIVSSKYFKQFSSYGADTKLHLKPSRRNNSKSMIGRVVTLVRDTLSWPVLHKCEVSWLYSKRFSSYGANTKLYLKPSRGNSESMKARVVILVRDTSSWSVLHSCEVTWLYSKEYLSYRADTKLHLKWSRGNNSESMTDRVATLICVTLSWPALHSYIVSSKYFKQFSSYGADTKLRLKPSRGNNSESMIGRVVTLVRDTTSWPVLHKCEVSSLYSKRFSSYGADTKLHLKPSWRNNSKSMIERVVTLVRDTLSWPVLHKCEVSWLYSKRFSSYGANTKLYLKPSRGNSESMKARVVILVRDTSSWSVLHSCEVTWLYSKEYLSYRVDTKLHLKWSRGNNSESMTGRVATLVCDTLSWSVLHSYKVSSKYFKRFSSYGADTKLRLKPSRRNNSESMIGRVVTLVRGTSVMTCST